MPKTQTYEPTHLPTVETELPAASAWDEVSDYVTGLTHEPDFIAYAEEQGFDTHSMEYADALSQYTEASIEQQAELIDERKATQIRLVANAPYVVHTSLRINELNNQRRGGNTLPKQEWDELNELKRQAVWYNQMMNDYMYTFDDESFSAISQATMDQALDHFVYDTDTVTTTMEGIVRGARTEAATRHLLDDCNVPYRAATAEEDLRGADVILTLPSGEYDIDIKKSLDQLAENNGGYNFAETKRLYSIAQNRKGHKKILFFPGFTDSDLGDNLRLDEETTNTRKDIIRVQLTLASNEIAA